MREEELAENEKRNISVLEFELINEKEKEVASNDVVEKLAKVYEKRDLERVLEENGNGEQESLIYHFYDFYEFYFFCITIVYNHF